jgi:hypothetical protein
MNELKQHASAPNQTSMGAKNLHVSGQITHPLSRKISDSKDNIESDLQNVCSSWTTDIVGDKYLNMLQQQSTIFQNDEKMMVPECSQCFIGTDQVMLLSRIVTIPRDDYLKDVKQPGVATKVLIKQGSIVSDNVASYGQSVQCSTIQVMHSACTASILGDVNEIKQGATTKIDLAEIATL